MAWSTTASGKINVDMTYLAGAWVNILEAIPLVVRRVGLFIFQAAFQCRRHGNGCPRVGNTARQLFVVSVTAIQHFHQLQ